MASRFAPAIDAVDNAIRHSTHFREWLRSRRWCGDSVGLRSEMAVKDRAPLAESGTEAVVFFLAIVRHPEGQSVLHLPLSISEGRLERDAFELSVGEGRVFVAEAEPREMYLRFVADALEHQAKVPTMAGDVLRFRGEPLGVFRAMGPPLAGDSTNLLVRFSTARAEVVFKSYKIPDVHNREPEILERLHRKQFRNAPRYLGEVALGQGLERLVVGLATEFVESVDLFTWMTEGWREELTQTASASGEFEPATLEIAGSLGDAAAALHEALFDRHPGPWQAETFRSQDPTAARRGAGPQPRGGPPRPPRPPASRGCGDDEPLVLVREALRVADRGRRGRDVRDPPPRAGGIGGVGAFPCGAAARMGGGLRRAVHKPLPRTHDPVRGTAAGRGASGDPRLDDGEGALRVPLRTEIPTREHLPPARGDHDAVAGAACVARWRARLPGGRFSDPRGDLRELLALRGILHREGRRRPAGDDLVHLVEVLRPDERLVLRRAVPALPGGEFRVLQLRVRGHPAGPVLRGELVHGEVQGVEPG